MLGIVFTEFMEMIESKFSIEVAEQLIAAVEPRLASGGAYTSVGHYHHAEMLDLVTELSHMSGLSVDALMRSYGQHLFPRLVRRTPGLLRELPNAFDLLENIEVRIHREVRKLYPAAELPSFECHRPEPDILVMHYASARPLARLAEGLIHGCLDHFGETADVAVTDTSQGAGTSAQFVIRRQVH